MNIIEQLILEKCEAIEKTAARYETLRRKASSGNVRAMRSNLIERMSKAENLLIIQDDITNEAYFLLTDAEKDATISDTMLNNIENVAYEADKELSRKQAIYDAYEEAIELLDKLDGVLQYIEAQEE